jgi:hypothetical protein
MSDDFGTVNMNRAARARELEILRQQYRSHRDALAQLAAEAPSEQLAGEYQRLIAIVDDSLRRIDDLEALPAAGRPRRDAVPPAPGIAGTGAAATATPAAATVADHQLHTTDDYAETVVTDPAPGSRTLFIILGAVAVLAILGWLIWRSSDRGPRDTAVADTAPVVEPAEPDTPAETGTVVETSAAAALTARPATHDYGIINKGTRATRQFEIRNTGDTPVKIQIARSTCRCLYYEYAETIAPKGTESVTVTVDGAKAKAGTLDENIKVSSKSDESISTNLRVRATIE